MQTLGRVAIVGGGILVSLANVFLFADASDLPQADKIARYDPETQVWTEFSLPIIESDARRIELDPTNPNRIWWSGDTSSHLGYIELIP